MPNLIYKDALIKELNNIEATATCEFNTHKSRYAEGVLDVVHRIKNYIDTIELVKGKDEIYR